MIGGIEEVLDANGAFQLVGILTILDLGAIVEVVWLEDARDEETGSELELTEQHDHLLKAIYT